jgi:hypothetical protein
VTVLKAYLGDVDYTVLNVTLPGLASKKPKHQPSYLAEAMLQIRIDNYDEFFAAFSYLPTLISRASRLELGKLT